MTAQDGWSELKANSVCELCAASLNTHPESPAPSLPAVILDHCAPSTVYSRPVIHSTPDVVKQPLSRRQRTGRPPACSLSMRQNSSCAAPEADRQLEQPTVVSPPLRVKLCHCGVVWADRGGRGRGRGGGGGTSTHGLSGDPVGERAGVALAVARAAFRGPVWVS